MTPKDITSHSNMERLERTQKLIRLYRSNECLWNPKSPGFHSGSVKEDAWRWITRQMKCGLTPDQVKLQVLSLRNYYSKECAAIRLSQRKGFSYAPRHSYFEDLQFLGNLDFEESKECQASFSQLNCLLEDVLIMDDCSSIKANYHPAFSEATFCDRGAYLTPCSSGYTIYNMILEPEPDQEQHIRSYKERATSGNDRWYPTTYCVQCNQDEVEDGHSQCTTYDGRGQTQIAPSGSRSSLEGGQNPVTISQDETQGCSETLIQNRNGIPESQSESQSRQKRSANLKHAQDEYPSSFTNRQKSSPRTQQNGVFVDMGNWHGEESTNNVVPNDNWPGPRLYGQQRQKYVPRGQKEVPDGRKSGSGRWKRNNDAICRRLQYRLAIEENPRGSYSEEGDSDQDQKCSCKQNDRRQSGEDQLNVLLLKKNGQQNDLARNSNNEPISDQGNHNSNQPVQNQCYCSYYQSNPNPQRCDIYGCQCMYCNRSLAPAQVNYYPPQQFDQNATNFGQTYPPPNQAYEEMENEYGRGAYPNQPIVYCINAEDPNVWVPDQSTFSAPSPAQMPMAPLSKSWPLEMENKAPGNGASTYPPNVHAKGQPERENYEFVECPAFKRETRFNDQRERSNRGNYQTQDRAANPEENSLASLDNPIYDEQAHRKQMRNDLQKRQRKVIDEEESFNKYGEYPARGRRREYNDENPPQKIRDGSPQRSKRCDDVRCPANRHYPNEERPSQRRPRNDDMVVSYPNSNYEDYSPPRPRRDRTEKPNHSKVYQLQTDDSQKIESSAYDRLNPREDINAMRTRPSTRNRGYEEEVKPSSKSKSQGQDRNPPDNGSFNEPKLSPKTRSKGQSRENIVKPKKKSEEEPSNSKRRNQANCNDETCPFRGYTLRQDKDRTVRQERNIQEIRNSKLESGKHKSSRRKDYECNDDTCPYAAFAGAHKERPRKSPQERGEGEMIPRNRYRTEPTNKTKDPEISKNEFETFGNARNEAPEGCDDCECDSDDNEYQAKGYRNANHDYDISPEDGRPAEMSRKYSRREEKNVPNKNNERTPKDYRNENKYRSTGRTAMECRCDNTDSDGYMARNAYNEYPLRENRNRTYKESNGYDRAQAYRSDKRGKGYDNYFSEREDQAYINSDNQNNNRNRNKENLALKKKPSFSRGPDILNSENECFCSEYVFPETDNRYKDSAQNRKTQNDPQTLYKNKEEIQKRTTENDNSEGKRYEQYKNRNENRSPETTLPKRSKNEKQISNAPGTDDKGNSNDVGDPDEGKYSKFKDSNSNDNIYSDEDCICGPPSGPNEANIVVSNQRKQAGSICKVLNALMECQDQKKESIGKVKKPPVQANVKSNKIKVEPKEVSTNDSQPSSVKNNPSPKTVKSTKVQLRSASPIRHLGTPRTQPGEPIKKGPATAKTGGPSSAKKPTMDTNAAANRRR
ncbi:homeobox protein 2 isoform X2 [Drosophila elegans]|uniref:homeobox protein 2 isoform X2 n=1 Tax=Drosophila elegans TaxID=30023 RepID=UPI001BC85BBC|nr:homeobox protein 2 isoform X2 [Drosophila elegans]